jgi:succinyl-diaminopimelate desuccinylase
MHAPRQNPGVPAGSLAQTTLELVGIPSESRHEDAAVLYVRGSIPGSFRLAHDDDTCLCYLAPSSGPLVVLAGHVDTVPAQDNIPGRIEDDVVHGLGASDMKGGVAVMIELARWIDRERPELALRPALLFFGREEIPVEESPLPQFFAAQDELLRAVELAVVLEPTDNELHAGCVGNLNARLTFRGVSAHSARPWLGANAIHAAVRSLGAIAELEPHDVELDGLVYREVVSAVRIEGGIAANVVPDLAVCELNFRYAPGRSPALAEERLRALVGPGPVLDVTSNSPSAPPALSNGLVERLCETGDLRVRPKQAWTPVAQFAEVGIDAVNFGPGATAYAHKRDEQVPVANLVDCYETLRRFLLGTVW